jgi:hypothetical protein
MLVAVVAISAVTIVVSIVVSPSIIPIVAPMMKPSSAVTFVIPFVSLMTLMPEPGIGVRAGDKR